MCRPDGRSFMDGVTASRYRNRYQRTGLEKEIDRARVNRIGYVSKEKRLQRNLNRSCCYSLRIERERERERESRHHPANKAFSRFSLSRGCVFHLRQYASKASLIVEGIQSTWNTSRCCSPPLIYRRRKDSVLFICNEIQRSKIRI